ncbi:hypothetical protein DJ010_03395 [Nocardioides silvaticus]|uniref:Uncharacterized protein n=1 Tax=Nocardioides silvaticus TaxID=2201891 RepID=A0A316TJD3_9ACTN|nr:hypothetical protein [Nocardioides silvaticus]PWN04677.1 hypothetical protein DJ010_03395 [Nocardioides silvaticus]
MDKELVKDIVGRPKWWLVAAPLIVLFLVAAALLVPKAADGATNAEAVPVATRTTPRTCPSMEWSCYTARHYGRDFRRERLRNSRGVEFTPRVKRMIQRSLSAKGYDARGDGSWWRDTLGITACMAGPRWTGVCRRGQQWVNRLLSETIRVTAFCAGAAVIGTLAGGGGWGAGKGALGCLWSRAMGLWD